MITDILAQTGQSLALRLATEAERQQAHAAATRLADLDRARQATTAASADGTRPAKIRTYVELVERENRHRRIADALPWALREAVRLNYLYASVATMDGDATRLAALKQARRQIVDIYRIARESVDG